MKDKHMDGGTFTGRQKSESFPPLSDAQMRRSIYTAVLLALLLPPAVGSTLTSLIGFYPFPELYLIFTSYTGVYVAVTLVGALWLTRYATRFIASLDRLDKETARVKVQQALRHLPWMLFGFITIYTIGGVYSADLSLEHLGIRDYGPFDHLYNQLSDIPIVLITSYPIFFYYVDRLGRYLGPRGITVTAIPQWAKLVMLGLVVPVLIDSVLIGYYLNQTGYFVWQTGALWLSLVAVAAAGTWLAWRSQCQGMQPIQSYIETGLKEPPKQSGRYLVPKSLDELGTITQRLSDLLATQKQLSGDLKQSRELADAIIDGAGALVVVMDKEGRIVRFNRAAQALSGLSFEEVVGRFPWKTFLPPEEVEAVRKNAFQRFVENPEQPTGRYANFWLDRNGRRYLTEWTNTVLLDMGGNVEFVVGVGTEITEKEALAKELREKANILDLIHDAVVSKDLNDNVTGWNKGAERVFGYTAEEMIGHPTTKLYPPDQLALREESVITPVMNTGSHGTEVIMLRKNGERFYGYLSLTLIKDAVGTPDGVIAFVTDITEQHKATQAMLESEARLNEAERLAKIGSWELDLVNNKLLWSDETFRMFEVDKEKFGASYEAFLNAIHPEDLDRVKQAYDNSLITRKPYEIVHRLQMADGSIKFVREQCKTDFDEEGKPLRSIGTVQDITELHLAEQQLRSSEQRFRDVIDATNDGIWDWNPATHEDYLSPRWKEILGYRDDELSNVDSTFYDLVHPDDRQAVADAITRHFEKNEPFEVELRMQHKDKSYRWILSRGKVIRDEQGRPMHMRGSITDIHARKTAEGKLVKLNAELESHIESRTRELRQANQMLQTILDTAPIRIFWKDRDSNFMGGNRLLAMDAGKQSTQELIGKSDYDMPWKESADMYRQDDARVMNTGEAKLSFEEPMSLPDGKKVWLSTSKVPIRDDDGAIIGVLGTYEDITARKQTELALLKAKNEAEQANQAKSNFLSRMSHELRTPLNAILGFGQLLETDESLTSMQAEGVHEIINAGKHLLELINEILDLSRIESGRIDLSLEPVELMQTVNECLTMVKPLAEQRQIVFEASYQTCGVLMVLADRIRLRQILINLLSNAIKYNREAGRAFIKCTKTETGSVRLSVSDNGKGIGSESIERLFRPFERLESAYDGIEGTGIGLALAKRLTEAMNGKIGVESEPGIGSTFWFELPSAVTTEHAEKDSHETGKDAHEEMAAISQTGTILYIEDNPVNLRLMQSIVGHLNGNLKLLEAMTAEDGIAMVKANPPNLILMDIDLPGMDGFEALKHLRTDLATRHIPVVAVTANAMNSERERGLREGFDDYLTKPLNVAHLIKRLGEFLYQ